MLPTSIKTIFSIRHDERWPALGTLLLLGFFQWLIISKFHILFANYNEQQWVVFMHNYHMSGFDPISYAVITDWHQGFDILRHPLLAYLLYPLHFINRLLWWATGTNCAQWIYGAVLYVCSLYSFLLLRRILHEVVGVSQAYATLLSVFTFGFAYVLLSTFVADHFGISLFLLLLTLYLGGTKLRQGQHFSLTSTILLFTLTTGVTTSNGVIVFIIIAFVNGRSLWCIKSLLLGFALPSLLLIGSAEAYKWHRGITEMPIASQQKDFYTNLNRTDILIENFLGESIQLHRKHILGDPLFNRPVIVRYSWSTQYVAEVAYTLFFLLGLWMGRRDRFLWMAISIMAFNLFLHLVLGFGLNEVYIMTAHWAFVIPIAIAYLLKQNQYIIKIPTAILLLVLTLYLWTYHGTLLYRYLTWPLSNA